MSYCAGRGSAAQGGLSRLVFLLVDLASRKPLVEDLERIVRPESARGGTNRPEYDPYRKHDQRPINDEHDAEGESVVDERDPVPVLRGRWLQAAGWDLGTAVVGLRLGRRRARRFGLGPLRHRRHLAVRRVDDGVHLPALDRFFGLEILRELDELVAALGEDLLGTLVAGIDETVHFLIDLAGDLFAVIPLLAQVAAEEDELFLVAEGERTELLGHAPLGDHAPCELGGLADVVRGPRGDVAEDELLRDPTAEDDSHV